VVAKKGVVGVNKMVVGVVFFAVNIAMIVVILAEALHHPVYEH
jgi:hypothetical protein